MPSVAGPVLNDAITSFQQGLCSIVHLQNHFPKHDNVEVHLVSGVHTRMIWLLDLQHTGSFWRTSSSSAGAGAGAVLTLDAGGTVNMARRKPCFVGNACGFI